MSSIITPACFSGRVHARLGEFLYLIEDQGVKLASYFRQLPSLVFFKKDMYKKRTF